MRHLTTEELLAGLDHIRQSPKNDGALELIVRRPAVDERERFQRGALNLAKGLRPFASRGVGLRIVAATLDYAEAMHDVDVRDVGGVPIPFASPRLLCRMKRVTHREKDAGDLVFLRHWFSERGEAPPD
jgi:hypothetical protein